MPPFDFPSPPTVGQIVIGPNNTQYQWDGTKWVTVVNAAAGGGVTISDTAPVNPIIGRLWFDSVGLQTYIWYTDPTSSQWTPVINQGGLLTDAPSNGTLYGRMNGAWSSVNAALGNYLPLTGGTVTGLTTFTAGLELSGVPSSGPGSPYYALSIDGPAGNPGAIRLNAPQGQNVALAGFKGGSERWLLQLGDATAESGSNAGSNFNLISFADNGTTQIGVPLAINRATGNATFSSQVYLTSGQPWLDLNKTTATNANYIVGSNNGSNRWFMALGDQAAESGSDAGSNFTIWNCHDSGATISQVLNLNRATGNATFSGTITAPNAAFTNATITNQLTINSAPNTSWQVPLLVEDSSLATGNGMYIGLGLGWSNNNVGYMCFINNGGTNSANNYVQFGVLGSNGITVDTGANLTSNGNMYARGGGIYIGGSGQGAISANGAPGLNIGTGTSGNLANLLVYVNSTTFYGSTETQGHLLCDTAPIMGGNYAVIGYYQNGAWYNVERASVASAGNGGLFFYNSGAGTCTWSTAPSDRRLKSNIKSAGDALDVVKRLPVYDLDFRPKITPVEKFTVETEHWPFSLIADEVAAILPHAALKVNEDDGDHWVALHPTHLCALLIKAVQQLTEELDALKAQVHGI